MADSRDHPRDLGNASPQDVAERQFRERTTGQDSSSRPDTPTSDTARRKPERKGMNHAFRASTGHAQAPVWEDDNGA